MPAKTESPIIKDLPHKIPVAIFSHGLAGNQTTVDRGFLVLSIEHRDGTASITAKNNYHEVLDYERYKGVPGKIMEFRQNQLKQRVKEVLEAHALLASLNNGTAVKNILPHTLPDLKDRLDIENSILIGHSFGAGTTIEVLQQPGHPFFSAITLDPWMEPVTVGGTLPIPMLSVQAEKFQWRENMDILKDFWNHDSSASLKTFSVVKRSGHQDISDIPAIGYKITKWFSKSEGVEPKILHDSYDKMIGAFLKDVLKGRNSVFESVEFGSVDGDIVMHGNEAFEHLDAFPPYIGKYPVGIAAIETVHTLTGKHGVCASLFYPCLPTKYAVRAKWTPGPSRLYGSGYINFIGRTSWLLSAIVSWFIELFHIQAFANAPLASDDQIPDKLPIAIFSHGLVGNQTAYSQVVGNLASRGFLVLSIEHRDGSACASARFNYYEAIPYHKPPPEGPDAVRFRQMQLKQRVEEIKEAYRLLELLNEGVSVNNILGNQLPQLQGRLDLKNSVIIGHSYGAATVLGVLQEEIQPFSCGIALDPWMYPVPTSTPIASPLLSIQCEKFHWRKNLKSFQAIWVASTSPLNEFVVVKNTKHNAISDFALIFPKFLNSLIHSGKMDPKQVHQLYDGVMINFLKRVWRGKVCFLSTIDLPDFVETSEFVVAGTEAFGHLNSVIEEFEVTKGKSYYK
ncbi:UNVERIFIED_CONTAM: Platelet-activating factor acetylhydrolase [Siphonaria sp. JEL0065]|nr:Platelet-activating factor acetylhydrolase [Siphonaria sp. JEL0065]